MTQREKMRIAAAEAQGWSAPWRFGNNHLHGTPPNSDEPATGFIDDEHVPQKMDDIIHALCDRIDDLGSGINAVRDLMNESEGVAGLHKNGDVAKWEDLEDCGKFCEWLFLFNAAEKDLPND